jgi:hypothetical protein
MTQQIDPNSTAEHKFGEAVLAAEVVLALGTYGNAAAAYLAECFPAIEPFIVGIDGEINRRESGSSADSMTLSTGSQAVWDQVRHFRRHKILRYDPLLPKVELPPHIGPGAARSRLAGGARYQIKRPQFVIRVQNALALALGELRGEALQQRQAIIRIHVITTSVSGSGAGYCPTAILDAIAAVQELAPTAQIYVTLHLIGPTCFRGLGASIVDKFFRNSYGLAQELIYLQRHDHLVEFAKSMEVFWNDNRGQLVDEIVDYHGANSRHVAFTAEETFSRIAANIRSAFDSNLTSLRIERDDCNRRTRSDWTFSHVVSSVQAKIACIPARLPAAFAHQWLSQALAPTLARADVPKLTTEEALEILKAAGTYETSVGRHFRQVATTFFEAHKGLSGAELQSQVDELIASLDRKLERTHDALLEHYGAKIGSQFERVIKNLSKRIANINGLSRLTTEMAKHLDDAAEQDLANANAIEREQAEAPAPKRRFLFRQPVNWFIEFVERRIAGAQMKTVGAMLGKYAQAARSTAGRLESLADALRELAVESRTDAEKARRAIARDATSIVAASEIDGLDSLLTSYLAERGEAFPALPLEAILRIRGGSVGVATVLTGVRDKVARAVRRQISAETVSSFAAALRLQFDLPAWIRETLATHGGSSPLVAALLPDAEDEKTMVVASGADFALVEKVLRDSPRLENELEKVEGRDAGIVMVLRGHDGAPISAMASYAASCSRADAYRRHHPHLATAHRLTLDETFPSSGFLLKAFTPDSPGSEPQLASSETAPHSPVPNRPVSTVSNSNGAEK